MENTLLLRELLHKYFHGKLTKKELTDFRSVVNEMSDEMFKKELDFIWNNENDVIPMDTLTKNNILQSVHNIIDHKAIVVKRVFNWWKIAAIIMMPILLINISLLFMDNKEEYVANVQEYTVLSGKGQKNQILLPDGTHIWLNSESEISYTSNFNQSNRSIKLKGEAFFDVKKNEYLPFNVEVDSINIQVLGTAFNVSAYADDPNIKVSLERGKVEVRMHDDNSFLATLNPNEQATIDKKSIVTTITDCEAYTESIWRQNVLKINNIYTDEMIKKLERWYGVHINVQNMPVSKRYGLTIKEESLREMLELINSITPIIYRIEGEEVTISYK
ncbi:MULTISPECIES: FecR family protein [Parabacteroides]|jgi:ferric-dicitrate binding protein FerR (iron transport regulator)|uniref:FecR family protein n=1 Tax=Parabacteroides TaxID=375288 RepID=UPI000EFF5435|nr:MULTISPECIES: FecR family protein [Parabacteroides]RHU22312.1 FecR family protein [Parabacteroides sp. TM07-1AC]WFE86578.1 FecR family protein [Parabacteroides chongii]